MRVSRWRNSSEWQICTDVVERRRRRDCIGFAQLSIAFERWKPLKSHLDVNADIETLAFLMHDACVSGSAR